MNMSGENDGCLYFHRSTIHHSYKNLSVPSSSPAGGDPGYSDCNKDYYL